MAQKYKKLSSAWIKDAADDVAREQIRQEVYSSVMVLERLHKILSGKVAEVSKTSKRDYDCPSWAYKAADQAGYTRALNEVLSIIKLEGMNV